MLTIMAVLAMQAAAAQSTGDAALLPPAHRGLVGTAPASLGDIEDPLSRLIAAGVLLCPEDRKKEGYF